MSIEKKIVYSDAGKDKGITGEILSEDEYFIIILSRGREFRINKKSIVVIKDKLEGVEDDIRD